MTFRFLFILLIASISLRLQAQDSVPTIYPPNERFGVKEGLSQGLVMSMMQDTEGFIWFGTKDGLNRYDGYTNTVYRNNPDDAYSLPENVVAGMAEDEYGNFWIATGHKGLYLFDKKTERFYATPVKTEFSRNSFRIYGDKILINTLNDLLIYRIPHKNLLSDVAHISRNIELLCSYNATQKDTAYKISLGQYVFQTWIPDCSFWAVVRDTVVHFTPAPNFKSWQARKYTLQDLGLTPATAASIGMAGMRYAPERLVIYAGNSLWEYDEKKGKIIFEKTFANSQRYSDKIRNINCFDDSNFVFIDDNDLFVFNERTKDISRWNMQQPVANIRFNYGTPFTDAHRITWLGSGGWGVLKCDLLKEKFTNFKTEDDAYFMRLNESYDPLSHRKQATAQILYCTFRCKNYRACLRISAGSIIADRSRRHFDDRRSLTNLKRFHYVETSPVVEVTAPASSQS